MPGNTFVQPVAGEPSGGTQHLHVAVVLSADPASTSVQTLDLSAQVPVGTTAVALLFGAMGNAANQTLTICNSDGSVDYGKIKTQVANQDVWSYCITPVTASRGIYWKASTTAMTGAYITMTLYFC
jgi:dUTPase